MSKRKVVLHTGTETKVKQSFRDQCDVNKIMDKYRRTGLISHMAKSGGRYGDFTGVDSYQEAMQAVIDAQAGFMTLDSKLRKRFNNDPAELIGFLADEANREEAVKLGLIEAIKPAPPVEDGSLATPPGRAQ